MLNETRELFSGYLNQIAKINGVSNITQQFTIAPSVQQKLERHIQESSDFLRRINVKGVRAQEGEKLGIGIRSSIASTTDTNSRERKTF